MIKNYFLHPTSIISESCKIGDRSKIWHYTHLMANCVIGEECVIGQNVFIASQVTVGNRVKIQNNVSLYTGVICEDDVFIGPSAVFTNVLNPRAFVERKAEFKATIVKKGATIGANSTIVCGIEIGSYALIGAGSVVTKNVPNYALIYGNPAKQRGWISKNGQKLIFINGIATCKETNEIYKLINNEVRLDA